MMKAKLEERRGSIEPREKTCFSNPPIACEQHAHEFFMLNEMKKAIRKAKMGFFTNLLYESTVVQSLVEVLVRAMRKKHL